MLPRREQRAVQWDEVTPFLMGFSIAAEFSIATCLTLDQGRHSSVLFTTSYCFFFLRLSTSAHNFLCKFLCPNSYCEQDTHLII